MSFDGGAVTVSNETDSHVWLRFVDGCGGFKGFDFAPGTTRSMEVPPEQSRLVWRYWNTGEPEDFEARQDGVIPLSFGQREVVISGTRTEEPPPPPPVELNLFANVGPERLRVLIACTCSPAPTDGRLDVPMANMFLSWGVPSSQVLHLSDDEIANRTLMPLAQSFIEASQPEETLFVYWGSHGNASSPQDFYWAMDGGLTVTGADVVNMIENGFAGQRVFFTIDSCHSGSLGTIVAELPETRHQWVCLASTQWDNSGRSQWDCVRLICEGVQKSWSVQQFFDDYLMQLADIPRIRAIGQIPQISRIGWDD